MAIVSLRRTTSRRRRLHPLTLVSYLLLGLFCVFELFPLLHILLSSVKSNTEINRVTFLPARLHWQNYVNVFQNPLTSSGLFNSLYIIVFSLCIGVVLSTFAGYALSRGRGKFYTAIYLFFLSAMIIPVVGNLAATYTLIRTLGLLDNQWGLILLYAAGMVPFGVLLYTGFVKTIPRELDEAAMIDGSGYFGRFFRVILPLLRPAIITHVVLNSIGIWNDFLTPLIFISSPEKKPLPLAIMDFVSNHNADWGSTFALLTFSLIPPFLFFLFAQRYIYQALSDGVLKG